MGRKRRSDRNHAIYMIRCTKTRERYIGITVVRGRAVLGSVRRRWLDHVYHAMIEGRSHRLQKAIRRHGPQAFTHELLAVVRGKAEAHALELEFIRRRRPQLNVEGTRRKRVGW
jgi:hypothetical protein